MKYTTEKVYRKDSQRIFNLATASLKHRLDIPSYTIGTTIQYEDDIYSKVVSNDMIGREYITVEIDPDYLIFHVLTDMFNRLEEPTIIGKIDLSMESDEEKKMWKELDEIDPNWQKRCS